MPAGGLMQNLVGVAPFLFIGIVFYMLIWRPQQQRLKDHQKAIKAVKRGDTVVLSSGLIGKVVRVEEAEVGVEIAQGVTVKVVKDMIQTVRVRGAPVAANDAKA
jgi:preprotein translocase subunit YajC